MHWLGHPTPFVLAAIVWYPSSMPIQHSLPARRGSIRAINVIRHPALRRILGSCYPVKDQDAVLYSAVASGRRCLGGQHRARGGAGATLLT